MHSHEGGTRRQMDGGGNVRGDGRACDGGRPRRRAAGSESPHGARVLRERLNEKDADAALAYVGDRYVQHNPNAADGRDGFRQFVAFLRDKYPRSHSEIKRSFVDGDYVILHVHAVREPGTRGSAIMDIFRLEHGKIVEHWDVNQPVPEQAANGNTMF
ncbi:hypothetical protein BDI4_740030 [Burkholderia diffusa]|nr:hypothetical protein BDI4_740030 [Burkholderia diffusa]